MRVFDGIYSKIAVSTSGNIQFSKARGIGGWTTYASTLDQLPSTQFGTALLAYQPFLSLHEPHIGVIGEAPNRVFVIDVYHRLGSVFVRVQYLIYERPAYGSHLAVIYDRLPVVQQPWSSLGVAMALQSSDLGVAVIFDGTISGTTRLDYNLYEMSFSGVPTAPLRAPDGAARLTLLQNNVVVDESTDYTLTCASPTAASLSFPLRLCAAGDAGCTPLTTVDISAAGVTETATFTCTSSFVGLSSLVYSLPADFLVTLLSPITVTNAWTLTVSGPAPFPTRVFTDADAAQSPIELLVQAGPRAAVGVNATSLTHWMSGSNCHLTRDVPKYVDPNGAASDANTPGSRHYAQSWTGKDGQLYLFSGGTQYLGIPDLWRYSPVSGQWTLLPMPTSTAPVYGTRGQSSSETTPGARQMGCVAVDDSGDAWLFGEWHGAAAPFSLQRPTRLQLPPELQRPDTLSPFAFSLCFLFVCPPHRWLRARERSARRRVQVEREQRRVDLRGRLVDFFRDPHHRAGCGRADRRRPLRAGVSHGAVVVRAHAQSGAVLTAGRRSLGLHDRWALTWLSFDLCLFWVPLRPCFPLLSARGRGASCSSSADKTTKS